MCQDKDKNSEWKILDQKPEKVLKFSDINNIFIISDLRQKNFL